MEFDKQNFDSFDIKFIPYKETYDTIMLTKDASNQDLKDGYH